jgi:hypothetical protein
MCRRPAAPASARIVASSPRGQVDLRPGSVGPELALGAQDDDFIPVVPALHPLERRLATHGSPAPVALEGGAALEARVARAARRSHGGELARDAHAPWLAGHGKRRHGFREAQVAAPRKRRCGGGSYRCARSQSDALLMMAWFSSFALTATRVRLVTA